jgi:PIN domain
VIIFDTSAVFGLSPDDRKFDLLRALKQSGQQRVAIRWMVQEELVAHRVLAHEKAHAEAARAARDLNRAAPWLREPGPRAFNRDEASDYWCKAYARLFEIMDTSGDVARQALAREANCEKPAKGPDAKDKGGARDAAIWLSVVEYLKDNPDEEVCFVTGNTHDFGDGSEFPAPMSDDVKGVEGRLQVLTSFDSVVSEFSTPLDIDEGDTERELAGRLTSDTALALLAGAVRDLLAAQPGLRGGNAVQSFLPEVVPAGGYPQVNWSTWVSEPKVILRRVRDAAGHEIGEDTWYTATVDWILVGLASVPGGTVSTSLAPRGMTIPVRVACQWRTKLLFSNRPGEPPTLLQSWPPQSLDPAEQDDWQPLVQKAMPQLALPQLADIPGGVAPLVFLLALGLVAIFGGKKDRPDGGNPPGPAAQ